MTRAHFVKAARKAHKQGDLVIQKGESYWWWKFMRGGRYISKTTPKRSQLTRSPFFSSLWDIEDRLAAILISNGAEAVKAELEDIASELEDLAEEQDDKKSNMPESLQEGPTGEMLDGRAESCREMAQEIHGVSIDDDMSPDDLEAALDEAQAVEYQGE